MRSQERQRYLEMRHASLEFPVRRAFWIVPLVVGASVWGGCGSTSALRSPAGTKLAYDKQFDSVQVASFGKATTKSGKPSPKVDRACGRFADLIAQELKATAAFRNVSRIEQVSEANEASLVISGDITRYEEGNAFARFMIGFGAGSSYFDALVRFADGANRAEIGRIKVDRNSWVLGGAYAAGQTADSYMAEAAKKIAAETKRLAKSKNGQP